MNKLKSFFLAHSITAHSIAVGMTSVIGAYYAVPQFHNLVMQVYGAFPASAKELVVTGIALVTFYYKSNPQETK